MCEILTIIKTNNKPITQAELAPFLERCIKAGARNKDGWGAFCENWYMRSAEQFSNLDARHLLKEYKNDSRFFAVHVRLATCEVKKEFSHPFVNNRLMFCHNGVINIDSENTGSDSLDLFKALNKKHKNKNLTEAIRAVTKTATGTYSVLIYSISEEALYYFRNNPSFDFMLCEDKNIIYGATDIDRLKPLQTRKLGFFETALESRPLKNMIYKINLKNGRFKRCGTFQEKEVKTYYKRWSNDDRNGWGWVDKR